MSHDLSHDLETNSVLALAQLLRARRIAPGELHDLYRGRIRRLDPIIHAFVDPDTLAPDPAPINGSLAGLPFGVKDVIDVRGFPTRAGSRTRAYAQPAPEDAPLVAQLRRAGLNPLGKTVTTEFAFIDPTRTRNPHNPAHSPGGSSSGSGAAVAAGLVPFALGTQTAGSLCRPAAYCGVAAIKPARGWSSTHGVVPLAQSFDTLGIIARHVHDAAAVLALAHPSYRSIQAPNSAPRLAVLPDRFHRASSPEVGAFHEQTICAATAAGASVRTIDPELDFETILADHRTIMLAEAHRNHGHLLAIHADQLGPRLREALQEAASIPPGAPQAASIRLDKATKQIWAACAGIDAILLQPVPFTAPEGLVTTGEQNYLTPWTAFGGPLVIVPGRFDSHGLPLAAMIAAAPGHDACTTAIAAWLESRIDQLPDHVTPASPARA